MPCFIHGLVEITDIAPQALISSKRASNLGDNSPENTSKEHEAGLWVDSSERAALDHIKKMLPNLLYWGTGVINWNWAPRLGTCPDTIHQNICIWHCLTYSYIQREQVRNLSTDAKTIWYALGYLAWPPVASACIGHYVCPFSGYFGPCRAYLMSKDFYILALDSFPQLYQVHTFLRDKRALSLWKGT